MATPPTTPATTQKAKARPDRPSIITRTDLLQALCDAAQLEHGLCCAYLFAALSLKRRPDEGVPPFRMANLRNWESVLLLISRQEMEHLGIVCNLLTAIGGMPYLENPSFPIAGERYGKLPALPLQRFAEQTIQRFIEFEKPEWIHLLENILATIQGADTQSALAKTCQIICAEMEWEAGDVWSIQRETAFPLVRIENGLNIPYDPEIGQDIWARWQTPHPPKGQLLKPAQTSDTGIVNTWVEIPTYDGENLVCVWRFFYETFRSIDEDDSLAKAVEVLLDGVNPVALLSQFDLLTAPAPAAVINATRLRAFQPGYTTIGGFYRQIRKGFLRMCFRDHKSTGHGLFTGFQTGNPAIGILDRDLHDMDVPTVSNLDSALTAIDEIIETGEGCSNKRVTSHYLRLCALQKDLESVLAQPDSFDPARDMGDNPVTNFSPALRSAPNRTLLQHPDAVAVAEIFDAVYEITLQMVARFFAFPDDKVLGGMAFRPLMTMVIRPLAEILGELNANENSPQKAGPPFQNATRDLLHPHRLAAWTVFGERLQEIAVTCAEADANLRPEHKNVGGRLTFISKNIDFLGSRLMTAAKVQDGKLPSAPEN